MSRFRVVVELDADTTPVEPPDGEPPTSDDGAMVRELARQVLAACEPREGRPHCDGCSLAVDAVNAFLGRLDEEEGQ